LLTNVIYNKTEYYVYKEIESIREKLKQSNKTFNCVDLGAGSYQSNSTKRTVKQLLNYSVKPAKYSQLLFRLVNHFQPETILELGTSLGITSAYISKANSKANFITIEGCDDIAAIAEQNFSELNCKNIKQLIGNFDVVLPALLTEIKTLDFVFFDGNHRKSATLNYFNQCLLKANENTVFVFDDIYWSPEMKQAWQEIKNHQDVKITIDLFFMGIVFFRKEQTKEHFILKF
jgi:predicted O-methyltransferase YrrM